MSRLTMLFRCPDQGENHIEIVSGSGDKFGDIGRLLVGHKDRTQQRACRDAFLAWTLLIAARLAMATEVYNFTGLPAYPNLNTAKMDEATRVDRLGRQCARFAGNTVDSVETVEAWYRNALHGASETDLRNDENYAAAPALLGIKLAVGVDYVTVYRVSNQASTTIELFRCSARA